MSIAATVLVVLGVLLLLGIGGLVALWVLYLFAEGFKH